MCYEAEHYIILGEILSTEGIQPSDDRISVINNMMKPQHREAVQRLLGRVNYVSKYIANLSNRTKYIRNLLWKNTNWNWSHEHENEWQDLKALLTHEPVLAYYDVTL